MEDAFFGRAEPLGAVQGRLVAGVRLLTVCGPGGVGKTRLCREVARALRASPRFSRPTLWIELSQVDSAEGFAAAVLGALAVEAKQSDAEAAVDRAAAALAGRGGALLVLDNFEQLAPTAARLVGRLLDGCEGVQALVTSRVPLGVAGEERFDLAPFTVPADDADGESGAASDAVRFLALRAGLDPAASDVAALASIARKLDGLPLALELAAARLSTLSPGQLRDRLDRPLDVLTRGRRDADPRQQSLRAALEHSWALLEDRDQRALASASVFAGAFALDAAEAVLDDALDAVQALHEASLLVRADHDGEPRFRLYESVRAFAAEKAVAAEALEQALARHARYFGKQGERAHASWQRCRDDDARAAAAGLAASSADLERSALRAASATDRARAALGLAVLLDLRGGALAVLPALRAATAPGGDVPPALRAWAHYARAKAERRIGDLPAAAASLAVARASGGDDPVLDASRLHLEALLVCDGALPGGVAQGRALLEQLATFCEAHGLRAAHAHNLLAAITLSAGDAQAAWAAIEIAQAAAAREQDPVERAAVKGTAARIAGARGDERALALATEYVDEARASGLPRLVVGAHEDRGALRLLSGELKGATDDLEAAAAGARRFGMARYAATATARLGIVSLLRGHHRRALEHADDALGELKDAGESSRWLPLAVRAAALAAAGARDEVPAALEQLNAAAAVGPEHAPRVARLLEGLASAAHARARSRSGDREEAVRLLDEAAHLAIAPGGAAEAVVFERMLSREVAGLAEELQRGEEAAAWPEDALVIAEDGAWFRPPAGARCELSRRPVLLSVLAALRANAEAQPEEAMGIDALFAEAWPQEKASADSRRSRVRMAISALRKEGLKDAIETVGSGYRLAPGLRVLVAGK